MGYFECQKYIIIQSEKSSMLNNKNLIKIEKIGIVIKFKIKVDFIYLNSFYLY